MGAAPVPGGYVPTDPSAGVAPQPMSDNPKKNTVLIIGSLVLAALLVAVVAGFATTRGRVADSGGAGTVAETGATGGSTQDGQAGSTSNSGSGSAASGGDASGAQGSLTEQGSYDALVSSYSRFSKLNDEYGPPRQGNTEPAHGWLRDNFGTMISQGASERRSLAEQAASYSERFGAAKAELEAQQVAPAYTSDKERLLAIYDIATRRADAYRQIAEYAVDHDESQWRALQKGLDTTGIKRQLLDALGAYTAPSSP